MNGPAFIMGVNRSTILARRHRNVHWRLELSLNVEGIRLMEPSFYCPKQKVGGETVQVFHGWAELAVA
jgi:hypothetical protein